MLREREGNNTQKASYGQKPGSKTRGCQGGEGGVEG